MKSFIKYIKFICRKVVDIMSEVWNGVEVKSTSILYAQAILEGVMTFKRVSKYFKSDTAVVLVVLGAEDLVTDKAYLAEAKQRIEQANQAK